jgi:DNA polymerase (family X)
LDLSEDLVARLAQVPGVERVTYAGSLRRMRDTVGDIDVLVAAAESTGVMEAFCSLPQVSRVLPTAPQPRRS